MIVKTADGDDYATAQCDHKGCKALAPKPGEWVRAHPGMAWPGWNSLGWFCMGGKHLCPEHAPKPRAM